MIYPGKIREMNGGSPTRMILP